MAKLLLIASLIGARGASGLSSAGNLELMHTRRTAPSLSRDGSGREFFVHAGVPIYPHRFEGERKTDEDKHWLITLAADATDAEAALILHEFKPIAQQTHPDMGQVPILAGYLTDAEVQALVSKFAGRIRWVEEDPMSKKIHDDTYLPEGTERRTYPWGITDINADMIRGRGVGVNVFVMDTGVRITHSQFGGRAFAGVDATSGVLEVCDPASTTCAADTNGHWDREKSVRDEKLARMDPWRVRGRF